MQRSELVDLARTLKSHGGLDEVVLLSTCNRVEIYGTTQGTTRDIKSLFRFFSSDARGFDSHIYIHEDVDAARHLFRVAAGLDSMMLGETEVTGQIKNAYELARAAGLTGRVLNRLFQRAFRATKEIRTRTAIGRGTVSIKSVAVELIEKIFGGELTKKSVMVIGAGDMAECCIRLLVKKGALSIIVSNRSFDRARDLARRCGVEAVCFDYCLFEMRATDVVIAATGSAETLVNRDDIKHLIEARPHPALLLIDLSVPRNIDAAVADVDGVSLYNIDDLEGMARQGIRNREREVAACYEIIDAHVAGVIKKLNAGIERFHAGDKMIACCGKSSQPH